MPRNLQSPSGTGPFFVRGVPDQGYWPDGLMTAPSDKRYMTQRLCARLANTLRKHIKLKVNAGIIIRPARYACGRIAFRAEMPAVLGIPVKTDALRFYGVVFEHDTRHHRALAATISKREWIERAEAWSNFSTDIRQLDFGRSLMKVGSVRCANSGKAVRELDATRPIDAARLV